LALAFVDGTGKFLKQTFVSLKLRESAFLDLTADEAQDASGSAPRVEIRGVGLNPLLEPGSVIPQPLACNLVPTLELFNSESGETVAILSDFTKPVTRVSPPPVAAQP
jgi:hypothetical protein